MDFQRIFKTGSLFGAAGIFALGTATSARAANLLVNPSFEFPTSTAQEEFSATGWDFLGTVERTGTNFPHNTGDHAIWFRTFDPNPFPSGVTQNVNVTAGADYTLTVQEYFQVNYASLTNAEIQISLTWLDASNNQVGTPVVTSVTPASNPPTNVWTPYVAQGTAPAGAAQVQVFLGWLNGGGSGPTLSVFADDADLEGVGTPPGSVWAVDKSGDWNNAENWQDVQVPNGVGVEADFFGKITANRTVFTDTGVTAGTLNFNNANTYVVTGAGSLTLQGTGTDNASVIVQQGTQKINLPTFIASDTTFNVSPGATLIVGDPLTINSGKSVTQSGGGTVDYQSIVTVQTGASIAIGNSVHAAALKLQGTSTASMTAHAGSTQNLLQLDSLSIDAGSTLDLTNNALLTNTTPQNMRTLLHDGAVFTSLSAGGHAIGYADQGAGQVKARYTYGGDANIDGQVDVTDLGALATNWQTSSVWTGGDFNYDGFVDVTDLGILATNWQQGVGNPLGPGSLQAALASVGLGNVTVPEPASASVLALAGLALAKRRRRR